MPPSREALKAAYVVEREAAKHAEVHVRLADGSKAPVPEDPDELEAHKLLGTLCCGPVEDEPAEPTVRDAEWYDAELELVEETLLAHAPEGCREDTVTGADDKIIWLRDVPAGTAKKLRALAPVTTRWYHGLALSHEPAGERRVVLGLPEPMRGLYEVVEAVLLPGRLVRERS